MENGEQGIRNFKPMNDALDGDNARPVKGDDIADRLVELAVDVIRVVDALPQTAVGKHIADQLLRSGTSPGANYEEARGAESHRDFIHKLGITLKELQETHYWLRIVVRAKLVPEDLEHLVGEVDQLCRVIGKSRVTARARHATRQG